MTQVADKAAHHDKGITIGNTRLGLGRDGASEIGVHAPPGQRPSQQGLESV